MSLLKVGDKIPDFSCYDDKENLITNNDLKGKKTIIFFYPKANTPGCTAQACNLSENYSVLSDAGFSIIGVSAEDQGSVFFFVEIWWISLSTFS